MKSTEKSLPAALAREERARQLGTLRRRFDYWIAQLDEDEAGRLTREWDKVMIHVKMMIAQ